MKLHLNNTGQSNFIRSCNLVNQRFVLRINDIDYIDSLILTPEKLELWEVKSVSELNIAHFKTLARFDSEVVILGTGKNMIFPDSSITTPLMEKGIGLEVMDTSAACRTYNILQGDERKVVAGLIL